ncbi:fused MFS/spermidine synthase [Massilia sp. W12]|uniref:fused MFS/spermidine synthase n=1 Tax=Massilia sp. W12 TaxID=3126507 RepID=UPI0030D165F3
MHIPLLNRCAPWLCGLLLAINWLLDNFSHGARLPAANDARLSEFLALLLCLPALLAWLQHLLWSKLAGAWLNPAAWARWRWLELPGWLCMLLPGLLLQYSNLLPQYGYMLAHVLLGVLAGLLWQLCCLIFMLPRNARDALQCSEPYIAVLFLISGFSALIYQVVWQRVLFATFGVNSEAVTVIVSVFMFGLGLGALAGGWLQQRFPQYLLQIFVLLELAIGVFGLFSLQIIHGVSQVAPGATLPQLLLSTWLILLLPTLFMGATLPVLVAYLQQFFRNVGKTVGILYAFNTIGSAIASFLTVHLLFAMFGQQSTVWLAAVCNLATAFLIHAAARKLNARGEQEHVQEAPELSGNLRPAVVMLALWAIGYISLSQEIVWYRMLGFQTGGKPQVFGMLLAAFLLGVAGGSLRAKQICEQGAHAAWRYLALALLASAGLFYLALPLLAWASALLNKTLAVYLAYGLVAWLAYFTGCLLPILIHLGSRESTMAMSRLYFANILGATCGPLLTGFVLLHYLSLETNVVLLSLATLALLAFLLWQMPAEPVLKRNAVWLALGGVALAGFCHTPLFDLHLEKMQYAKLHQAPFRHVLQNRSGIITVEAGPPDVIYGGGIYDGRFNRNPLDNSNLIDRTYLLAAMHAQPAEVLEIGFSSGSWARIINDLDTVRTIDIVEINPGYPAIVQHYPDISPVLQSPKVKLHFDDGRRWLRNNPARQFDVIVMNTTFYWRSNASNLLSQDFLRMLKKHLKPGGLVYYNSTGSPDVLYTAAAVFPHVTKVRNFVAASERPLALAPEEARAHLLRFRADDGSPLFARDAAHQAKLEELLRFDLSDQAAALRQRSGLRVITDDNMLTEYKLSGQH